MNHKPLSSMRIALATDHAGFSLKEHLKGFLKARGHEVEDFGAFDDEASDYPDFVYPAARSVGQGKCDAGIVMGGSGNGEAITANKARGVRCAVCWSVESARLAKQHNNANVIAIGARLVEIATAEAIVSAWLESRFEGGRHAVRIEKIAALEKGGGAPV